eukprot:6202961-Pleurochrysis_carterae.AAC.2
MEIASLARDMARHAAGAMHAGGPRIGQSLGCTRPRVGSVSSRHNRHAQPRAPAAEAARAHTCVSTLCVHVGVPERPCAFGRACVCRL